jgi:hypothetical protein
MFGFRATNAQPKQASHTCALAAKHDQLPALVTGRRHEERVRNKVMLNFVLNRYLDVAPCRKLLFFFFKEVFESINSSTIKMYGGTGRNVNKS